MNHPRKHRSASLTARLGIAFGFPLVALTVAMVANGLALGRAVDDNQWLLQRERVLQLVNDYSSEVLTLQSAKRAFTLTSDPRFVETAFDSLEDIRELRRKLGRATLATDAEAQMLANAEAAFQNWLNAVVLPHLAARESLPVPVVVEVANLRELALLTLLQALSSRNTEETAAQVNALALRIDKLLGSQGMPDDRRAELARVRSMLAPLAENGVTSPEDTAALEAGVRKLLDVTRDYASQDLRMRRSIVDHDESVPIDALRAQLEELIAHERSHLVARQREMQAVQHTLRIVSWFGPLFGLALLVGAILRIGKQMRFSLGEINNAARALENGQLDSRARGDGAREFSELTANFNRMAETIQRRHDESTMLMQLSETLQTCENVQQAIAIVRRLGPRLFSDADGGSMFIACEQTAELEMVASWGTGTECTVSRFNRYECWALRLGRAHENKPAHANRCEHLGPLPCASICLPLRAYGDTFGLIIVHFEKEPLQMSVIDSGTRRQFYAAAVDRISLALANIRMRTSLREQAIRDSVTGLYNRRYLQEILEQEVRHADRHKLPIGIMVVSIANLQAYKHRFGKQVSEQMLKEVAHFLADFFRAEDTAFRFDEDVFVALLTETRREDAARKANLLRREIALLADRQPSAPLPGISVDVVSYPADGGDTEAVLRSIMASAPSVA